MKAAFVGHETLTFMDYLDAETGRTLVAEPGRTYDITPASGRPVDDIPAGWFVPVQETKQVKPAKAAEDESAPENPAGAQPGE